MWISELPTKAEVAEALPGEDMDCESVSAHVARILRSIGLEPELVWSIIDGTWHCFIECRGYVIDYTASQFGWDREPLVLPKAAIPEWYENIQYKAA